MAIVEVSASQPQPTPAAATASTVAPGVGAVTRSLSWVIDAVIINLVAIITGAGVALLTSMFPFLKSGSPAFKAIAAAVYVLWSAAYFVVFWTTTGQTPGARIMLIRLATSNRGKVRPTRALVRWVGMELAIIPLCAGYLPVLWRRRPFPDWVARTLVLRTPQMSLAMARQRATSAGRARPTGSRAPAPPNL